MPDPFDELDVSALEADLAELSTTGLPVEIKPLNISGPEALVEFSRVTREGIPWQYNFTGTMTEARSFVHAIRAQLTKWRERARDAGVQFYPFRTKAHYERIDDCTIRIFLARNDVSYKMKKSVDTLFDNLTGTQKDTQS